MSMPPTEPRTQTTCYRHPDRPAGVSCQRCNRPICPSCMTQASVGFQCPECVKQGAAAAPVYSAATLPGTKPMITWALIAINAVAFVAQLTTISSSEDLLFGAGGTVYQRGVLYGPAVGAGEWWRLISSGFLHAGIIHIGMNMFVLYTIGPQLERLLGPVRFIALYVASLLGGSLGVILLSPTSQTLGASGAIFGLLGAAAAYQVAHKINIWKSGLGNLIVINVIITVVGSAYISVGGHLGGLVGGGAVGWLMFQLEQRRQPMWVGALVGLVAAVAFAGAAVMLAPTALRVR